MLCDIAIQRFRSTGTLRNDRIRECPAKEINSMNKEERDSFDYQSCGDIEIKRWNDNSVVILGSNAYGVEPFGITAERWVKGKSRQNIKQPAIIAAYNKGMGGSDMLD